MRRMGMQPWMRRIQFHPIGTSPLLCFTSLCIIA